MQNLIIFGKNYSEMGHHGKLRSDKTCLNCGHQVEERFCPHCGQENIEKRQPFHYLFTHFIEDFTHYDGQFWGTLKNLFFRPGKLTSVYLEGKRQLYVPPVKLYIFMSFITFFIFALFPPIKINITGNKPAHSNEAGKQIVQAITTGIESEKQNQRDTATVAQLDKTQKFIKDSLDVNDFQDGVASVMDTENKISDDSTFSGYKTREEYDKGSKNKIVALSFLQDPIAHKFFELKEAGIKKGEIYTNLIETSFHNIPKALFIYLPVFAFFLWIFHKKKKWWYFDHGIFTLHYFSFLLASILITHLLSQSAGALKGIPVINSLIYLIVSGITIYSLAYFFIAHHRVYKSHGVISFIIGCFLFTLNFVAFLFLIVGLAIVSFLMMH
nr:DUF3667 domain-containing protein [Elizabethkingia sp. ASV34]